MNNLQQKVKNNKRKRMVDDVISLCIKKQWCEAEELFNKYLKSCFELWKQYDTLFNYKKNKCGYCTKMKQALVKQRWSEAERYPMIDMLTCVNNDCLFYLVFYCDN